MNTLFYIALWFVMAGLAWSWTIYNLEHHVEGYKEAQANWSKKYYRYYNFFTFVICSFLWPIMLPVYFIGWIVRVLMRDKSVL